MNYAEAAKNLNIGFGEVAFFTSIGVAHVAFEDFDQWYEDMSVWEGEEGRHFKIYFAITFDGVAHANRIWETFTRE